MMSDDNAILICYIFRKDGLWQMYNASKFGKGKVFTDSVRLLYDQTLIIEGLKPDNPLDFAKRLNEVLNKSL